MNETDRTANPATKDTGEMAGETQPEPSPQVRPSQLPSKRPRGFAAMDRKQVSDIARKGGRAAHAAGTAHEFTSEEARLAGGKGGRAIHRNRRARPEPEQSKAHAGGSDARS
jgi:general stress protein YciG